MVYLIYKGEENKKVLENTLVDINNYLYKTDSKLEELNKKISLIDYNSINNKELLKRIDKYNVETYEENDNRYYSFYNKDYYTLVKQLIGLTTSLHSERENSKFFYIFYDSLITEVCDKITNIKTERTMLNKMTNFALIVFSNRYNLSKDNDLLKGFLYDQKSIEDKYDRLMGEGSFDKLNKLCYDEEIHHSFYLDVSPREFHQIMTYLRRYFYKNMSKQDNLSLHEKNDMVIRFNSQYRELKDSVELIEYKKKMF